MPLSSLQLEAFLCLAQSKYFVRAAERLHITQSALSQRVLNLEDELGTALVVRDRAGVRLTDAGAELLRYCQAKEALEAELLSRLRPERAGELVGVLRIAGYSSVLRSVLLPAMAGLLREHPKVRLHCMSRELSELPGLLKTGEADLVVLDRVLERAGLVHHRLGEEHYVLVEQKGYRGEEIYLDHDEDDQTSYLYFRQQRRRFSRQRHYLGDIYGLLDGVKQGLGRAVLPRHLISGERTLKVLHPGAVLRMPVVLHFHEQPYYSKLHEAVVEVLKQECPRRLETA